MRAGHLPIPHSALSEFCDRNSIRKLSLFGSVLTDRFRPDSDIDVLVEFIAGRGPSLLGMACMERELGEMFRRKVDLRTLEDLSPLFRSNVIKLASVQHEHE
jgi:predicted nucleotidyltransferase